MKYKDADIIKFLTEGGRSIDNYLIVLDPGQSGGKIYTSKAALKAALHHILI